MIPFDWGDRLPQLPGRRVTLRELRDADVPALYAAFSDPDVMRYWDVAPMTSLDDAAAFLADIRQGFRTKTLFQWGIEGRVGRVRQVGSSEDPTSLIGTVTLLHLNPVHRRGEIGFALRRSAWGQGLASDAVAALLAFCFDRLDLHRIEADVDPRNDRSLRLLERLGFVREGYLRERYHAGGEIQDAVLLGLLRPEWRRSP